MAYADGGMPPLVRVGAVVSLLLFVLARLVVPVLHTAYAVGDSHARGDGGPLATRQRFPATPRSSFVALYRSWVLTHRARWRTLGVGTLVTVGALLVLGLARYAAAPLAHFAGLGMLWLSDGNVWITGVLVKILPTAVALLLLPPVVMPLVCAVFARLHGDLRTREEATMQTDWEQPAGLTLSGLLSAADDGP
ncbi:hypothetical protein [Streptomyces sp. NPDC054834]